LVDERLVGQSEEGQLNALADQRRQIVAIQREAERSTTAASQHDETSLADTHRKANRALQDWQEHFESAFSVLRQRITKLMPDTVLLQTDPEALQRDALPLLRVRKQRATDRATLTAQNAKRETEVAAELVVARKNLATIDAEIGRIAENSGNLAAALAELSSFVTNDICPVCDRNFAEQGGGSLAEHVNHKVRILSGSAERLLGLGKNRGDQQILVERLEPKALADLEREAADLDTLLSELAQRADTAREGTRLAAAETAARRALAEHQSRNLARTATMATLTELTETLGLGAPEPIATPQSAITQILATLDERTAALNLRVTARRGT
jgi:exonuclease SbcC